jgi:hypothetical protein
LLAAVSGRRSPGTAELALAALSDALASISGSIVNTTFSSDLNGNQTAGLGRIITWTSYNKPNTITQGTRTISFNHAVDHQRFTQVAPCTLPVQ